jgi:hypothetical protein
MDLLLYLCLYLFISYSLTLIITQGVIFESLRNFMSRISPNGLGVLFSCIMCAGFWIGLLLSIFLNPIYPFMIAFLPFNQFYAVKLVLYLISMVLGGALASGFSWVINTIVQYLDVQTELAELTQKKIKHEMLLASDLENSQIMADQLLLEILEDED